MADIHIDDFYKDVGRIFLRLYNCFPRKTILYVEDISGADQPDEFGLHSERFLAGFGTMVWLGQHHYLHYEAPIKQEALDQAILTERAFLMLSSRSTVNTTLVENNDNQHFLASIDIDLPPSVVEESLSNVAQLRKALRSGSSIDIQHCIHSMLSDSYDRHRSPQRDLS